MEFGSRGSKYSPHIYTHPRFMQFKIIVQFNHMGSGDTSIFICDVGYQIVDPLSIYLCLLIFNQQFIYPNLRLEGKITSTVKTADIILM